LCYQDIYQDIYQDNLDYQTKITDMNSMNIISNFVTLLYKFNKYLLTHAHTHTYTTYIYNIHQIKDIF